MPTTIYQKLEKVIPPTKEFDIIEKIKEECIDIIRRKHQVPQVLALGKVEFAACCEEARGRRHITVEYKGDSYEIPFKRI